MHFKMNYFHSRNWRFDQTGRSSVSTKHTAICILIPYRLDSQDNQTDIEEHTDSVITSHSLCFPCITSQWGSSRHPAVSGNSTRDYTHTSEAVLKIMRSHPTSNYFANETKMTPLSSIIGNGWALEETDKLWKMWMCKHFSFPCNGSPPVPSSVSSLQIEMWWHMDLPTL